MMENPLPSYVYQDIESRTDINRAMRDILIKITKLDDPCSACHAHYESLAAMVHLESKDTISKYVKKLEKKGYVKIIKFTGRYNVIRSAFAEHSDSALFDFEKLNLWWKNGVENNTPEQTNQSGQSRPNDRHSEGQQDIPAQTIGSARSTSEETNINNYQFSKKENIDNSVGNLIDEYGIEIFTFAYEVAKKKQLQNNLNYLRGICKNKAEEILKTSKPEENKNQEPEVIYEPTWSGFIEWCGKAFTKTTSAKLKELQVVINGNRISILTDINESLKLIIEKYFSEMTSNHEIKVEFQREAVAA